MEKELTIADAENHPAFTTAVANATARAHAAPDERFAIYYDGKAIFVRVSTAAPPPKAIRVREIGI